MRIIVSDLFFKYKGDFVLKNISLEIPQNQITAIKGPSGAGKSSLLICLNRLWEDHYKGDISGSVLLEIDGKLIDIYSNSVNPQWLRQKIGMVFQNPNPFPMSIEKNLVFPLKLATSPKRSTKDVKDDVIKVLKKVYLYDEVKKRMNRSALSLSGGQQQRLCIARALMAKPEVLLLDEPTSSLDLVAEEKIEMLLKELKNECTIVMVSHSKKQIQRLADKVVSIEKGEVVS